MSEKIVSYSKENESKNSPDFSLLKANYSHRFSTWDATADQKEENNVVSKMILEDREDLRKMLKEMDELEEEGNSPLNSVQFSTQKVIKKA